MPDLPKGPDDMTESWFLDLYKGDKVARTSLFARTVFAFDFDLLSAAHKDLCQTAEGVTCTKISSCSGHFCFTGPLLVAAPSSLFRCYFLFLRKLCCFARCLGTPARSRRLLSKLWSKVSSRRRCNTPLVHYP